MKRFLVVVGAFILSTFLVGCSSDTYEDLITDTIKMLDNATTNVGIIKSRVNEAVKESKEKEKKLDLSAAIKATEKLKETGDETQKLKRRIEQVRSQITEEQRKEYVTNQKGRLADAYKRLLAERDGLRAALAEAEKLPRADAKQTVKEFREKLLEAESPFEALSR